MGQPWNCVFRTYCSMWIKDTCGPSQWLNVVEYQILLAIPAQNGFSYRESSTDLDSLRMYWCLRLYYASVFPLFSSFPGVDYNVVWSLFLSAPTLSLFILHRPYSKKPVVLPTPPWCLLPRGLNLIQFNDFHFGLSRGKLLHFKIGGHFLFYCCSIYV